MVVPTRFRQEPFPFARCLIHSSLYCSPVLLLNQLVHTFYFLLLKLLSLSSAVIKSRASGWMQAAGRWRCQWLAQKEQWRGWRILTCVIAMAKQGQNINTAITLAMRTLFCVTGQLSVGPKRDSCVHDFYGPFLVLPHWYFLIDIPKCHNSWKKGHVPQKFAANTETTPSLASWTLAAANRFPHPVQSSRIQDTSRDKTLKLLLG